MIRIELRNGEITSENLNFKDKSSQCFFNVGGIYFNNGITNKKGSEIK